MNRIDSCFAAARQAKRKVLITYIVAGDPQVATTVPLMHKMVAAGADIIEIGVPFSDPMAEGPVIQAAHERALLHNVSLRGVLAMVKQFRETDKTTPVIAMGYLNPIEVMGYGAFVTAAKAVDLDGVLTVDLPPEEADELATALRGQDIAPIFLIAPTTSAVRMPLVCKQGKGFLYYVSLKGVTGAAHLEMESVTTKVAEIRQHTQLPLAVGFGIRDAASAKSVAQVADAVVVGSALVQRCADHVESPEKIVAGVTGLIAEIRQAIDA